MLIIVSGVSGSGKNTVIDRLLKKRKNLKIFSSVTTRQPREKEEERGTYKFITTQQFKKAIEDNLLFEYELVHGHYRGILKEEIQKIEKDEINDYIRDIDVKGNKKLRNHFDKDKIISIFLEVPDDELKRRLILRGDKDEDIALRLSRAPFEREFKNDYDYIIDNIDLEKTINKICEILDSRK